MSKTVWREEIRGFAYGIFFVSVFGFVWAAMGSSALPDGSLVVLAASVFVSLALISAAFYLRRASRFLPESPQGAMSPATWRRFQLVGVAQGMAIGAAVFVLVRLGRPEWIPAVVALIVGLHFFPLASIFRLPLYHASGALLCAVAALAPIPALVFDARAAWFVIPGLGCALVLWATGAVLVVSGFRLARETKA
ncbi:MAG: hypothetical protein ACRDSJ_16465 [Rubrobacteraceae bacterium]